MKAAPIALAAMLAAAGAQAQVAIGDPEAGRRIAESTCARCHAVTPTGRFSPMGQAPTFRVVADDAATTPLRLRVFLTNPHAAMPDFQFARDELEDVIAYILSLRAAR